MKIRKPQMSNTRKSMDSTADPYLTAEKINGDAVCKKCQAVYHNKRWSADQDLYKNIKEQKNIHLVLCSACRKVKDNFPGGILKIKGDFYSEHEEDIMNLIRNEEKRAQGFNPLERIMEISTTPAGVEITTTNEKLTQKIGKSIQRAYQGRLQYKWSDGTKLLRAEWQR